jgi:hypothetical protein
VSEQAIERETALKQEIHDLKAQVDELSKIDHTTEVMNDQYYTTLHQFDQRMS